MFDKHLSVIFTIFLCFYVNQCLEIDKSRRYNQNSDFLLHEATGSLQYQGQSNSRKRDYIAPSFSSQSPSSTSQQTNAKITTSPKRDFVNPNGKRDYVSPSTFSTQPHSTSQHTTAKPSNSAPRRDFVNPKFTSPKPLDNTQNHQNRPGQVQDLVNFFDSKSNNGVVTPKPPSYSSILQGTTKQTSTLNAWGNTKFNQPVTQSTPKLPAGQTTKSYSSIVSGSNTPSTVKPSTKPSFSTSRLPSAIVNNNKNNNQASSGNGPSDAELQSLSEELLRKDTNNAAKYVTINYQEKTTSQSKEDKAPLPLLTVSQATWNIPTIQKFVPLLDNYERDTLVNEYVTPQERNEENAFMDAIMSTTVIRHMMNFLKEKGYVTPDPRQQRDFLKQLWFGLYSRGKGKISSSGFEHIFVSELRNGEVLGLHNWIYFAKEEAANRVNYLGYLKYLPIGDKGAVMKLHFNQNGADKPVDTMFVGTSPELEIALYTICFVTRADNDCKLKLANKDVQIVSHTFRYRSKNLIGSAYPQI
ncbi:endoribonuclease CG2145-like [Leguminivora glycinivorella]|uniref:endoribonuclease CG2145-like n=1 Tax=Leguminivora glycinivorella TaxID=1035111 RepID=UPI00200CD90E|nr:endoribonuclease CG2145-like [Leguminivora glycinivorella]